jgi:drug/metabolite transporter (DMT)-like permease
MNYLDIAEANVLMFTNPAWTGLLAWLILGQVWSWYEMILCVAAFAGVVLVARPPFLFPPPGPPPPGPPMPGPHPGPGARHLLQPPPHPEHPPGPPWHHWLGVLTALGFAIFLSIASLIINTKLKGKEKPNTVSLYLFLGVVTIDLPFLLTLPSDALSFASRGFDRIQFFLFLGIGIVFYGFQFLRSWALLVSNSAAVVNLLYCEIVFAFLWGILILHQPFFWSSFTGAAIIIVGCLIVSRLKSRSNDAARLCQSPPLVMISNAEGTGDLPNGVCQKGLEQIA